MAFPALQSELARRMQAVMLFSGCCAALPVLFLFNPAQGNVFPPCPFRWATGWLCPGCGSLRAMHAVLHGDVAAAFALNPLMLVLLPLVGWLLARHVVAVWRDAAERPLPAVAVWALLLLTLAYSFARNLSGWPAALGAA